MLWKSSPRLRDDSKAQFCRVAGASHKIVFASRWTTWVYPTRRPDTSGFASRRVDELILFERHLQRLPLRADIEIGDFI